MIVSVPRRLFTVDEYYRMAAAGVFQPGERVELLDGEIVPMNPIGSPHAWCVTRPTEIFAPLVGRVRLRVQHPIRLHDRCEPEPDLALVRRSAPQDRHPSAADTLLIVEAADNSLRKDRGRKRAIYARARIPESWIVDLSGERVEIYRQPTARGYRLTSLARRGEIVSPLCTPDLDMDVSAILGDAAPAGPTAD
ncbi:MAG: Uma2 family endonuclease [Chloroflexi bacterium]|nr:Uma2 family endonuclease [Chloroflexota bacterium]